MREINETEYPRDKPNRTKKMTEYTYLEETPSVETYNRLRVSAGWGDIDPMVVDKALSQSLFCVVAKKGDDVIGFARMVGDGGLAFYIQEIVIDPRHQNKGIGTAFMEFIMSYLEENAPFRAYVGVFAGKTLADFYRRYGFWERPTSEMGPGMMQFWDDAETNARLSAR